jgi:hypothetical protein
VTVPPSEQGALSTCLRTIIGALPRPVPLYCLVGALTVNAWGRLRTTQDIDVLVMSRGADHTNLIQSLVSPPANNLTADRQSVRLLS